MSDTKIRAMVFVVIRRGDQVLVWTGRDDGGGTYQRFIGGGIELGESAAAAAVREVREELGVELSDLRFLGVVEDMFPTGQGLFHELGVVFEGVVADPQWYERDRMRLLDDADVEVSWRSLTDDADAVPLYPAGVRELLTGPQTVPRYVPAQDA